MSWMIGVDVGGTFTDFFAFNDATEQIVVHKVPSTPTNPAQAVIAGLHELANRHAVVLDAITRLSNQEGEIGRRPIEVLSPFQDFSDLICSWAESGPMSSQAAAKSLRITQGARPKLSRAFVTVKMCAKRRCLRWEWTLT